MKTRSASLRSASGKRKSKPQGPATSQLPAWPKPKPHGPASAGEAAGSSPRAPLLGTRASTATEENSAEVPQKLKTRITIGSRKATIGDLPKGQGTLIRKDARTAVCFILLRCSFRVISAASAEPALALAALTGPALAAAAPREQASVPAQTNDTHDGTLRRCKARMNSPRATARPEPEVRWWETHVRGKGRDFAHMRI